MRSIRSIRYAFLICAMSTTSTFALGEIITLRSGQIAQGGPGQPRQLDRGVRYLPTNPERLPVSSNPFTVADFAGARFGPQSVIIEPLSPPWITGISDPQARWINWRIGEPDPLDPTFDDNYGVPGSSLYAAIFDVQTSDIASATLAVEYAVDDTLGDWSSTGGNPDGLYLNGASLGHHGGGFTASSFYSGDISGFITPGFNFLYFYQRDLGASASGLIFSATIDIVAVPAPGTVMLLGAAGVVAHRRRR